MLSRIFTTSLKSGLLATIFFFYFFRNYFRVEDVVIFFLIYIVTTVIAFFAILFTIMPFQHYFKKNDFTDIQFVKLVFPYYAVTVFALSIAFLITDLNSFVVVIPTFVASISAWFWLFKP